MASFSHRDILSLLFHSVYPLHKPRFEGGNPGGDLFPPLRSSLASLRTNNPLSSSLAVVSQKRKKNPRWKGGGRGGGPRESQSRNAKMLFLFPCPLFLFLLFCLLHVSIFGELIAGKWALAGNGARENEKEPSFLACE